MAKKKNPAAVALGKLGARKRNQNLSPEERSEIARRAGKAGGRGRKPASGESTDNAASKDAPEEEGS